jgi:hypothetical protein
MQPQNSLRVPSYTRMQTPHLVLKIGSNNGRGRVCPKRSHTTKATEEHILSMPVDDSGCLHRNNHRFVCERAVPRFVTQVGQASFAIHTSERFLVWGEPIVARCPGIQSSCCGGREVELLAVVKEDGGRTLGDVDGHTSDRAIRLIPRSRWWLGECCTQQLK